MIRPARIEARAFRIPIAEPVATSFGVMRDRPAVILRIEDGEGCFGFGEAFANWPAAGAEHRVRLFEHDIAPLAFRDWAGPADLRLALEAETRIRALQCGEPGPFRQIIAALDIAMHDLAARRAGRSLRRLLRPDAPDRVGAYASGIDVRRAGETIARARDGGFRHFKVKVGFDDDADPDRLRNLAGELAPDETLAADANQAWDLTRATRFVDATRELMLEWLEEPLPADADPADWAALAATATHPLAAGENIAGEGGFAAAIGSGALHVLQPDAIKWGGVSGSLSVAREALAARLRLCPHFLGSGIGLAASGEILAAAGGDGRLEVDVNPNPLRSDIGAGGIGPEGEWRCVDGPGLGITALPTHWSGFETARCVNVAPSRGAAR